MGETVQNLTIVTEEELLNKLEALGPMDDEARNRVVCSLIGHSRIQTYFFGEYCCARCGAKVGDSLMSVYTEAEEVVIVGHNCPTCRANYEKCTWRDKIFAPDPFAKPDND